MAETNTMQAASSYKKLTDFMVERLSARGAMGEQFIQFTDALPGEIEEIERFFQKHGCDKAIQRDEKVEGAFRIAPLHINDEAKKAIKQEASELGLRSPNFWDNFRRKPREEEPQAQANDNQNLPAKDVMALAFRDGGDAKFNAFKNVSAQDFKEVEAFLKENNCLGALSPATYEEVQKNGGRITIETKELSREAKIKLNQRVAEIEKDRQQPKAEVEKPEPKAEAEKKGPQKSYDGKEMLALAFVVKATDRGSKPIQEFSNVTKDDYDKTVEFLTKHNAMGALKPQKYENIQQNDGKYTIDYSKMDDNARQELIDTAKKINPKAVDALENKMGRHKNEVVADIIEARKEIISLFNEAKGMKAMGMGIVAGVSVVALTAIQPVAWLMGKVVNGLGLTGEDEVQRNTVQDLAAQLQGNLPKDLIKSAESAPKPQPKPEPKPQTQTFEGAGHKAPANEITASQSTPAVEASIRQTPCERVAKFLDRRINNQAAQATDNEINYDKAIKFPYMDEAAVNKVKKTLVESGMKQADVDKAVTFEATDGRSKGRMEIKFSEIPPEALKKLHEKGTVEGKARESAIEAVKSMKEFQANDVSGSNIPSAAKAQQTSKGGRQ